MICGQGMKTIFFSFSLLFFLKELMQYFGDFTYYATNIFLMQRKYSKCTDLTHVKQSVLLRQVAYLDLTKMLNLVIYRQ